MRTTVRSVSVVLVLAIVGAVPRWVPAQPEPAARAVDPNQVAPDEFLIDDAIDAAATMPGDHGDAAGRCVHSTDLLRGE